MVPRSFTILNEFPLNANGKVDRKYLAQLEQKKERLSVDMNPADLSQNEKAILAVWEDIFGAHGCIGNYTKIRATRRESHSATRQVWTTTSFSWEETRSYRCG
jgi:hypothetical protein